MSRVSTFEVDYFNVILILYVCRSEQAHYAMRLSRRAGRADIPQC